MGTECLNTKFSGYLPGRPAMREIQGKKNILIYTYKNMYLLKL